MEAMTMPEGVGDGGPLDAVPLREYAEAIFERMDRAVNVAEQEREKSAQASRDALERTIQEGDRNLRDHIENQVQQIHAALVAADKLEEQRVGGIWARLESMALLSEQRLAGLQREATLQRDASQTAIDKSEAATEKRFESVNEWRGQSLDRERSQQGQMAALTSGFVRREVADAQHQELDKRIRALEDRVTKLLT